MRLLFNIYTLVLILFVVLFVLGWFVWMGRNCPPSIPCPPCPDCPKCPEIDCPDPDPEIVEENKYLKNMNRYLTLILKRYEAEKELYKLSHGYAQVYNSPKLEYLKKELRRMKERIKQDPQETRFFEINLNNIIE